jgi:hypothetical protein
MTKQNHQPEKSKLRKLPKNPFKRRRVLRSHLAKMKRKGHSGDGTYMSLLRRLYATEMLCRELRKRKFKYKGARGAFGAALKSTNRQSGGKKSSEAGRSISQPFRH